MAMKRFDMLVNKFKNAMMLAKEDLVEQGFSEVDRICETFGYGERW